MDNILKIIEGINNINNLCNIVLPNYEELWESEVDNNVNKNYTPYENEEILREYVDNISANIPDVNNMYNYSIMPENMGKFEEIYNNSQNMVTENIHSQNISNNVGYKGFAPKFVDKSENFGDNHYYSEDNNDFFHNNSVFKEIYGFVDNISAPHIKEEKAQNTSNININLGGVTQNITEASCDKVLQDLSDILLRALSGCDGVY